MNFELVLAQLQSSGLSGGQGTGIGFGYWILIGATALVSMLVSGMLKRRFKEHSQVPISYTGAQVAEMMLRQNGINDVKVMSVPGQLTDHYDPTKKTVNLSESVYQMNNVAAAAVAAHECGHAVQHQQAYAWLTMRSKMVPAVQFASRMQGMLLMIGIFGAFFIPGAGPLLITAFIAVLAVTTLFSVVTLPVEFDASNRAMAWMDQSGIAGSMERDRAKNALFWAAMTYVAAALGAVAQLVYWAVVLLGGRRN